jgi:hypothetical protein
VLRKISALRDLIGLALPATPTAPVPRCRSRRSR